MHVIVVGCGRVGSALAGTLSEAGHSVAVVDRRAEAFGRIPQSFTGTTHVGIGFDRDLLRVAGIENAEALASVTSGDNSNILIARVARETFSVPRVVARIYDPRRAAIYQRLGIPTVATVAWTTERVLRRLVPDDQGVEWVDPSAKVCLVERVVPPAWAGHRVVELNDEGMMQVAAVQRLGVTQLPKTDMVLQEGDVVYLTASGDSLDRIEARMAGPVKVGGH